MLRLGSAILASALLGVPRALEARAFGAQRSVYVQVAPESPELTAFAAALFRALGESSPTASRWGDAAMVVEVHGLWPSVGGSGPACEAVSLTARDGRATRRLILRYSPAARPAAARALLRTLDDRPGRPWTCR